MHAVMMGTRNARRTAMGAAAALAVAVGAVGLEPVGDADARSRDDGNLFHQCLSAGGNYMECLYWYHFQRG